MACFKNKEKEQFCFTLQYFMEEAIMEIRELLCSDIEDIIDLYMKHLTPYPPKEEQIKEDWLSMLEKIQENPDYHIAVGVIDGKIISSITLVIIRNLTHNLRPYSVVENVVTHSEYRNKGYASKLFDYVTQIAEEEKCYKIMLMTGSKRESTLNFYKKNGFSVGEKTACLKRIKLS